jgi:ubiquinone/menaquinone biosynthesis C-methylase UbiE
MQKVLNEKQIEAFHHDVFVEDQVKHFQKLLPAAPGNRLVIVDVGGGIGHFAFRLREVSGHEIRVLDLDPGSIELCRRRGVECRVGDALNPTFSGDEQVVTFNMILHHLVGGSERETREMQSRALCAWKPRGSRIFVNEYIYDSLVGNSSGRMIFEITRNKVLSWIGRAVSTVVPSMRANTFGVGVRFRALEEWRTLFEAAGFRVAGYVQGADEPIPWAQRLLLIKSVRRDSFLLEARDS